MHVFPSSQLAPLAFVGFVHVPLEGSQSPAEWHWSCAVQVTAVPVQAPPWQASAVVQALPSLQVVPSDLFGFVQAPVDGLHDPATWHWSCAAQVTGFPPLQIPPWQVSVCVQALPSLQLVPSAIGGFEHAPLEGLQVPAVWHWSCAAQVTGLPPVQVPD